MINWESDDWGGGVTYAANGSWVVDRHGEEHASGYERVRALNVSHKRLRLDPSS